jgi:hypothetical protein
MSNWKPFAATTLIGSMPHTNRDRVIELVLKESHQIPVWPQLSNFPAEQMAYQYLEGIPGLDSSQGRLVVTLDSPTFEQEVYDFYEAYLAQTEGQADLFTSRFALGPATGKTFFRFLELLEALPPRFSAVKGQVIGPFTLLSMLKDPQDRALLYDEQLQDVVAKHLAMKAKWQIAHLRKFGCPVILFMDEPGLAGFGSSAFIAVSAELVQRLLGEVVDAIHQSGALAGIHICANTDWQLVFESQFDVINFDAFGYFDKFALYRSSLQQHLDKDRFIAWGMVPTHDAEVIHKTTAQTLAELWFENMGRLFPARAELAEILARSIFTPSCGCGSLQVPTAERVLHLTHELGNIMQHHL